jgi:hypothetical protein
MSIEFGSFSQITQPSWQPHFNGYGTLFLDSRDRQENQSANSFNMKNLLAGANTLVREIKCTNARVNWCVPTIVAPYNTFFYDDGSTNWQITLTPGWYSRSQLAAEIQFQVRATSGDITFTCTTPAYSPTYNPNDFEHFTFHSANTNVGVSKIDPNLQYSLGLSIREPLTSTFIFGRAACQYTPYIDFCSSTINQYNRHDFNSNGSTQVINRFYIDAENVNSPSVLEMVYQNPKIIYFDYMSSMGNIDLSVVDAFGNLLPVSNGDGFEFTLNLFAY